MAEPNLSALFNVEGANVNHSGFAHAGETILCPLGQSAHGFASALLWWGIE
jgi:hypothetical protein